MLYGLKWIALAAGLALGAGAAAQADGEQPRMRICSMDVDYPPFARVDGSGTLQYLVYQAARNMKLKVQRHVAPRRRCLEELKSGLSDAMVSAYSPQRTDIAVFPMADGEIDASMALGVMTYHVYRMKGAQADWDGSRFSGLADKKIGVQSGFIYVIERLQQLGMSYDDGAKALEPNLAKLAAGRLDAVVGMMEEADRLIARSYPGQIERTGKVFEQTPVYLMVSRQFHARHPQLAERYWEAIRQYRGSVGYRRYQLAHP